MLCFFFCGFIFLRVAWFWVLFVCCAWVFCLVILDSPDFVLSVIAISLNDLFDKKCSAAEEKVAYKENGNNLGISITLSITCFAAFTTHLIGTETVAWLGEESLKRYMKLKPSTHGLDDASSTMNHSSSSSSSSYRELQLNVIRSHAAGVGSPLSAEKTRMLLALRVNVLAKGCSGISPETLHQYIDAFNG